MKKIFISYARRDSDRVYPIADILESAKFDVWIDKNDIPIGEQWPEKIAQGIKAADIFLIFISPASLESKAVNRELTIAFEEETRRDLQICPVILTPTEIPDQARFQLAGANWIDLSVNFHENLKKLISDLGVEKLPKNYKKHLLNHMPGLHITPELIAPYKKTTHDVVVGKTISIDHIRDQRFMNREVIFSQVFEEFDLHLQDWSNSSDPEIFTFWIYGRSGSGKSVLLLQIMQEIILKRNAQVIWLDDEIELVSTFLEKWASQRIDLGEPLFIFVDDFNAPQERNKIDFKAIARLLRNPFFSTTTWPILVTCSPPEYMEDFQETGNNEYFQIRKWLIPPVSKSEQTRFSEWFTSRTNENVKSGTAFEQDEGLILSLMLEFRFGNPTEFAKRFRERLEGSRLLEEMAQLFALNRLYIWVPTIWLEELTPQQQDALSTLNLDQDFSIFDIENRSGKYIRLTHPHISDAIYKSIRPNKSGYQRANDLALAFGKAIEKDDVLASRILLEIARGGKRISDDINEKLLVEKIFPHFDKFVEFLSNSHPIGLAYAWTNMARWASREQYVNDLFTPISPLDKAITELGTDHYSWGDLWLQLWSCHSENENLFRNAWGWLKHPSHFDEATWYPIWLTIFDNSEILHQEITKSAILQIGNLWLRGRENRKWWSRIWQKLLENNNDLPENISVSELLQIGENWLNGRENIGQWSFVWQDILKYSQDLSLDSFIVETLKNGIAWLDGREDQTQWAFIWQDIIKSAEQNNVVIDIENLIDIGINWLDGRHYSNQWTFVWKSLIHYFSRIQSTKSKSLLIKQGLSWINNNKEKKEWPIIYDDLVRMKRLKEFKSKFSEYELDVMGIEWIEIHKYETRAAQSALVLIRSYNKKASSPNAQWQAPDTYYRLIELIKFMVFKTNIKSQDWPMWWLAYWETTPTIKNVTIALSWMEVCITNLDGARIILNKLINTNRPEIVDILFAWQEKNLQNPISKIIKSKLDKIDEGQSRLFS